MPKVCKQCEKNPVYEFTNKRKLCKQCFVRYFHKKFLYIIRKFGMVRQSDVVQYKNDGGFRGVGLDEMLKMFSERAHVKLVKKGKSHRSVYPKLRSKGATLKLKTTKYKASKGDEYFLEMVNKKDILFGLLRLRIVGGRAIIREVHVYGKSLRLGDKNIMGAQHSGLGKQLIEEAEKIARGCKGIQIISGVGVRQYYKKLGYRLEGEEMVKL